MHALSLYALVIFLHLASSTDECSQANRNTDLNSCLTKIRALAQDRSAFWFGTDYKIRCPVPMMSLECSNPRANQSDSIASRLYGSSTFNANLLDRYIDVTFHSQAGKYTSCGTEWSIPENKTLTLDPTSSMTMTSWDAKLLPDISWTTNTAGENYTLFVIDVGNFINHGIYFNIPGNQLSQGEAFKPYHGPKRMFSTPNIYVFFLFKQTSQISLTPAWEAKLKENMFQSNYTIPEMMAALDLTGPVALNWNIVTGDAYSVQSFIDMRLLYMCPYLIQTAIHNHNRSFIPPDTQMTVYLDVTFTPQALVFTSCCKEYSYPTKTVTLDPLGDSTVKSGDVRANASPVLALSKLGAFFSYKNFAGTLYTLLCVDPDVPFATAGTKDRPLLHWQVVNIQNGNVSSGDFTMTYAGPAPPDNKPHYYYFLLYQQDKEINITNIGSYNQPPGSRFLFNISGFVSDHDLRLQGATWMVATTDEYTRYDYVELRGRDPEQFCAGVTGYAKPCPISIASSLSANVILLSLIFLLLNSMQMS